MVKAPSVPVLQYYCGAADDSDPEQRHGNSSHTELEGTILLCYIDWESYNLRLLPRNKK